MADVKIDIPNIGEVTVTNAASESTLRELLKAMGGRTQPGQQGGAGGVTALGDASKEASKKVEGLGEASEEASTGLEVLANTASTVLGGAFNLLTSAIGATIGSVVGMGKELLAGGNQLTDFAQYLPIPGLTALSGLLDNQVNLFRELSSTGAAFGNNMFEITRIAGNAAIPQRDFAELLSTQADSLRLFGASVQSGARSFAGMSKEMRQGGIGPQLMAMGFSTQELNENLISYNEMMQVSGRRRYMSDQDLVQGAQAYSRELDKIAKLTGKSREQLAEEMKQKNLDIRRQMAIAKYGEEFGLRLQQAAAVSPQFEAALLDMSDGIANDPLTRQLMAQSDTFRQQATNIQNMTAEEFNNFTRRIADEGMDVANRMGEAGVQTAISLGSPIGEFYSLVGSLQRTRETQEGLTEDEQKARDEMTAKMTQFAEIVNDIRGQIQVAIIDSGIFQDIKTGIADFLPTIPEAKEKFNELKTAFVENILPSLNSTWEWLKGDGLTMVKDGFKFVYDEFIKFKDEYWPLVKNAFDMLLTEEGRAELIQLVKTNLLEWAQNATKGFLDWVSDPENLIGTITAAFLLLNPLSLMTTAMGAIIFGILAFFDWETEIKPALMAIPFVDLLVDGIKNLFNWVLGIFDLDVAGLMNSIVPDWAKRWLPDSWFEGTSSSGPSTSSSPTTTAPTEEEISRAAEEAGVPSYASTTTSGSGGGAGSSSTSPIQLAQLNTNMSQMVDLMRTQNRILRQMDGNLVG